ncbi:subtilase-type protease inhibitor [Streptomyces sp. NPDC052013]|uniref:subtilase-type protease inhibitor n=1 Tax=Streptomyces sp. NPDC052013 TaxID=3365679 RepID=UPI0037D34F62
MRKLTGLVATVLAAAGLAAATPSAAQADTASLYAPSALVLTTAHGEGPDAAIQRAVTLSCAPRPMGTHPAPASACAELRQAAGDFQTLLSGEDSRMCPMIYAPVTVGIEGVWQGQRVSWQQTFSNGCKMAAATDTGALFAF